MKNLVYILLIGLPLCLCSCVETEVDDKALLEQVNALCKARKYEEAVPVAERLVKICQEKYGMEHSDAIVAVHKLGWVYFNAKSYNKAESTFKRNLEVCKKVFGYEHPQTADCISSISALYYEMGDLDKAEQFCRHALELREKIYGPDHEKTSIARGRLEQIQEAR